MNLLYLAPLPIDLSNLDGVPKKIIDQTDTFTKNGINVTIITYLNGFINLIDVSSKKVKVLGEAKNKIDVIRYSKNLIPEYDVFYIRYPLADFFFISLLKSIKKENKKVVVEIPTYPYDNEGSESLKGVLIHVMDKCFRWQMKKYVDRIVTFTGEDEIFGIKTIKTINGFDFGKVTPSESSCNTTEQINMIAVSAMYRVHGYDRLLKGISSYIRNGGKRNIVLHLVGAGDFVEEYRKIVREYNIENNVIFHGKVFGEQLYKLYDGVAVGVNSLAIHRQNLKKESTLKTKEYAAMGLPVVSSSYVDAFSDEGNRNYVCMVPADETDIDINGIIEFVDRVYVKENSISQIRETIRRDGFNVCDVSVTIKPIVEYIKE